MKIIYRIYEYFEYKGISPTRLEKKLGIPITYFVSVRRRDSYMGEKMILMVLQYLDDLNPSWLLFGEGEMIVDLEKMSDKEKMLYYDSRIAARKLELSALEQAIEEKKEALSSVESES
jgi:hypothetical protein